MIKELKAFLFKGNIVDLAVAVIFGSAFGAIITSLVEDIITPLLLNPVLKAVHAERIAELRWNGVAYGNFLSAVLNFLIVGTILFFVVKATKQVIPNNDDAKEPTLTKEEKLLTEIRDLLAKK